MTADIAKVHDIQWYAEVPRSIWKQTLVGLLLIAIAFGGFGTWAFTAPLAAAIISQGSFVATGQNKIVQHYEGGIINEILVSEGERVTVDQPLLRLDETAALVNDRQVFLRHARLEALVARLKAQVRGAESITFPQMIKDRWADPEIVSIVESQELNREAMLTKMASEIGLLEQNIASLDFRAEGYEQQLQSLRRQLLLLQDEHQGKLKLLNQGLLRKTEVSTIERAIADADGQAGRLMAEIAETGAQRVKIDQQIVQTRNAYSQLALDGLQNAEAQLDEVREQARQADDVLRRATIHAPVSGTVVRLYYHTAGGVIESGKQILEILPSDVPLIIEAQIPRVEIDNIKVGQKATVRLVALNQRTTPVLDGEVFYVSANSLPNSATTAARDVYLARVSLDASELARVPGFAPTPGMPAEILIQTAERTFFEYLAKPIKDSMARAFSER